jgi:hypothetical protein
MSEMKPHWCSFHGERDLHKTFEYHGPWWVSGCDSDDRPIIVAAVMATDEVAAMETLRLAYDEDGRPADLKSAFAGR